MKHTAYCLILDVWIKGNLLPWLHNSALILDNLNIIIIFSESFSRRKSGSRWSKTLEYTVNTINFWLPSLTISRVLDGSDSHMMRMQLHFHFWGGKPEDPDGPIAVSCSHTCTILTGRRAPAYTATGLPQRTTLGYMNMMACSEYYTFWHHFATHYLTAKSAQGNKILPHQSYKISKMIEIKMKTLRSVR